MIRRLFVRSALPGGSNTSSEDKLPGPTSQQAPPTTGSPSVPKTLPSVSTGPDTTTTTPSSSHASAATQNQYTQTIQSTSPPSSPASRSTVSSLGAYPPLTSRQTSGQIPTASIGSTFPSSFDLPSSYQSDGTSTTYNGSGTSTDEPKSPSSSSYSSMNTGNGGQTKSSALSNAASTPSPIGGTGGIPQNSPPTLSPPLSDIGPSPTVLSGVNSSPSSTDSPTSEISETTTSSYRSSTSPSNKSVPTSSYTSPGSSTPFDPATTTSMSSKPNGPPQTITNALTSTTSSSHEVLSLLSSTLSPNTTHNAKSSTTTSSSSLPTDSTTSTSKSSNAPSQTTTNIPSPTTSSSLSSSTLSPNKTHATKSSATTSSSSVTTDSTTSTSTTTSAPTLTSSSQGGSVPSSTSSSDKTHPAKSSAATSTSSISTEATTSTTSAHMSTSSSQDGSITSVPSSTSSSHHSAKSSATTSSSSIPTETTTSTTSAHISTSSSRDGSTTSVLSSTHSSDKTNKPGKSTATTSSALTGDPQTSSGKAPSPSSTYDPPSTTQPQKAHTHTTTTPNSPAAAPTSHPGPPITTSSTTLAGDSPTTMPGEKSHSPQSSSGNLAGSPSPTMEGFTSVTDSSGGSPTVLVVKPSNDPAGTPSFTAHGTTLSIVETVGTTISVTQGAVPHSSPSPDQNNVQTSTTPVAISSHTIFTTFTTISIVSIAGSTPYTTTYITSSPVVVSTSIPGSGTRSNENTIIEGVVGGILALVVLTIAACYFVRRKCHSRQQQLHYRDLTAPLSPEAIETMRETHPYRPTYDSVGGQYMRESLDTMHRTSGSFISSAFAFPRPAAEPGSLHSHVRNASGSVFYENDTTSNDGYAFSGDEGSEGRARYSASEQSLYTSNDWQSSVSVGVGIAIGSESSMDLHSYRSAATTLAPIFLTPVDNDEELESPGPSPSSFPAPPGSSSMNPFLDVARTAEHSNVETLHALHRDAVSARSEAVALAPTCKSPEQQASWKAAVAAASPTNAQIQKTTGILNPFTDPSHVASVSSESSSKVTKIPTQSVPLITPFSNSSFLVNPFLRETSQEGFSDDSRSSESHETVAIPYAYSDPSEFMDKGKGKAYLSADLLDDVKRNRLSNASSGLEIPENPSQCGIAL